jgi:hypothetical protein
MTSLFVQLNKLHGLHANLTDEPNEATSTLDMASNVGGAIGSVREGMLVLSFLSYTD